MTRLNTDIVTRERPSFLSGIWYIAEHKIRAMRGYGFTMIFGAVGGPLIYLFALGIGLATLVDSGTGVNDALGVSFLLFVAPGLLASTAMMTMTDEMTYTVYGGFKWNPVYVGMNSAPISGSQIALGHTLAATIRVLLTVSIYYLMLVLFGAVENPHSWLMIFTATLTGAAIGVWLMSYAAHLKNDTGQLTMLMRFVITPMFLFSGTFFPLTQLPIYMQWIGWISPLWHGNELGRVLSFDYAEPLWLTLVHLVVLVGLLVFGLMTAARVFERRLSA